MKNQDRNRQLETHLIFVLVGVILYGVFREEAILVVAVLLGITGLFIPFLAQKITKVWFGFSRILGGIMSKVVLTIVYFLLLTPIAVVYRLLSGKKLFFHRPPSSSWRDRNHRILPKDLKNPW